MVTLIRDLRFAVRQLARRPGLAAVAILTLGLGIGASTTLADFLNLVLWREMPGTRPQELVSVYTASPGGDLAGAYSATPYADYSDYRDAATSFTDLAAMDSWQPDVSLDTGEQSLPVISSGVSGNYFEVLGVAPIAGRGIIASDDVSGAPPVLVISHSLWHRAFGGEAESVGRAVRVNGRPFTLVGVLPEGFHGTVAGSKVHLWTSMTTAREVVDPISDWRQDRTRFTTNLLGRLRPGVDRAAAQAELDVLAAGLDQEYPLMDDAVRRITVTPARLLHPYDQQNLRSTAALLSVGVGLLLLLTSANVANLLLSQSVARHREIGMRRALGAGIGRIVRQLLTESTLLALAGGIVGLGVASGARELLIFLISDFADLIDNMGFDYRVLGLSLLVCLGTGIVFGMAPAISAVRLDMVSAIKAVDSNSGRRFSAGDVLVVAQVALCTVLLVSTVLLTRSLWDFHGADMGYDDENVAFGIVDLSMAGYSREEGEVFYRQLEERMTALPGVRDVGLAAMLPPVTFEVTLHSSLPETPDVEVASRFNFADEGFFRVLDIQLLKGRLFDSHDAASDHGVAVINQALAEKLWPAEDPIGKTVITDRVRQGEIGPEFEIVGVVASTSQHDLRGEAEPIFYFSTYQRYRARTALLLRGENTEEGLLPLAREELRRLDPSLTLLYGDTMQSRRWSALYQQRLQTQALGLCAALGLLLAVVGVGSVMSFAVDRRRRELGIRMAIGARGGDIRRLVLGRAAVLAAAGLLAGGVGALWGSGLLAERLYGVATVDPFVFIGVAAILTFSALAAAWLPARRASRVDPLTVLRSE